MADDILIVDDEKDIRSLLSMTLEDEGYATLQAANADEARTALLAQPPKLAILDIWMRDSDMDGIELLEWVKSIYPSLPVLMISGHGTIETAVQAIRLGAYDFIEKPFKEARLLMMVERALDNARLARENIELRARIDDGETPELIGNSAVMRNNPPINRKNRPNRKPCFDQWAKRKRQRIGRAHDSQPVRPPSRTVCCRQLCQIINRTC